jgi:hypothetical protein
MKEVFYLGNSIMILFSIRGVIFCRDGIQHVGFIDSTNDRNRSEETTENGRPSMRTQSSNSRWLSAALNTLWARFNRAYCVGFFESNWRASKMVFWLRFRMGCFLPALLILYALFRCVIIDRPVLAINKYDKRGGGCFLAI